MRSSATSSILQRLRACLGYTFVRYGLRSPRPLGSKSISLRLTSRVFKSWWPTAAPMLA